MADGCNLTVIAFYCPSASVLMRGCVISWELTLVTSAEARSKFIAHQSIAFILFAFLFGEGLLAGEGTVFSLFPYSGVKKKKTYHFSYMHHKTINTASIR